MSERPIAPSDAAAVRREEQGRIDLANSLLANNRYGTSEHERGLELLLQTADGPLGSYAQWLLGAYYLQVSSRPQAHAEAARWLQRAVDAGVSPAIDRMADLYLQGMGVAFSPRRALGLQRHLADRGHAQAAWQVGYLEGENPPSTENNDPAATGFLRACALGYPPAYYSLGLRFAMGEGVDRDTAFARALLLRAADAGFLDARSAADDLVPAEMAGSEASAWHARLKSNLDAAQPILAHLVLQDAPIGAAANDIVLRLEAHLASVGHPAFQLDGAGRVSVRSGGSTPETRSENWTWLAARPRIGVCREFASREECAHLMNKVASSLSRPQEYRSDRSANDDAELASFSGRGHPLGAMRTDSVVRILEHRVATATRCSIAALEPSSVICYQPGEEYRRHVDFFSDEQIEINRVERGDPGGQRLATFLLYLHVPAAGGETEYPESGVVVRGEQGMAVLHYNVTADGRQEPLSVHIGRAVERGEKWLWRTALREYPLYA